MKPRTKRRTASKEERQVQLIKATIRSIARHGLSLTTMATVAKEAKLSQGIINLHFQSKDRLLEETLRYVSIAEQTTCLLLGLRGLPFVLRRSAVAGHGRVHVEVVEGVES